MNAKLKLLMYAISIFVVFLLLTWVLRLVSNNIPDETVLFGIYSSSDLLLGGVIAVALTFSHYNKMKLR